MEGGRLPYNMVKAEVQYKVTKLEFLGQGIFQRDR
jgi:hypothetical protein